MSWNLDDGEVNRGFLIFAAADANVPEGFRPYSELATNLSQIIGCDALGREIANLPALDLTNLAPDFTAFAKMTVGLIVQASVWEQLEQGRGEPRATIPAKLATALVGLSAGLEEPPIFNYADYILRNSSAESVDLAPADVIVRHTFTGTKDERAFIGVHTLFELRAGKLVSQGRDAILAAQAVDEAALSRSLQEISECLTELRDTLVDVGGCVNTNFFRDRLRIYLQGWKNILAVEYEGTNVETSDLRGETGAQSSVVPYVDAVLGLNDLMSERLAHSDFIRYMPREHRALIANVDEQSRVRETVISMASEDCRNAYNSCLEALIELRKAHLRIAFSYIGNARADGRPALGTGGTDYGKYLSGIVDSLGKLAI